MARARADDVLPRGRHQLTRQAVEQSQRDRMAAAVIALVAEQGLTATSVKAIVAEARVSRETFYLLFGSKDDCYESAVHEGGLRLAGVLRDLAADAPAEAEQAIEQAVSQLLQAVHEDPDLAHCLFVQSPLDVPPELLAAGVTPALERLLPRAQSFDVNALSRMTEVLVADRLAKVPAEDVRTLRAPLVRLFTTHARAQAA